MVAAVVADEYLEEVRQRLALVASFGCPGLRRARFAGSPVASSGTWRS
jgi:hypothetical protein